MKIVEFSRETDPINFEIWYIFVNSKRLLDNCHTNILLANGIPTFCVDSKYWRWLKRLRLKFRNLKLYSYRWKVATKQFEVHVVLLCDPAEPARENKDVFETFPEPGGLITKFCLMEKFSCLRYQRVEEKFQVLISIIYLSSDPLLVVEPGQIVGLGVVIS